MKGSKRKGRRPGTWELRVDAGPDPLTRKRQQKSATFHGTSRQADVALAELITKSARGQASVGQRTVAHAIEAGLRQAELEGLEPTTLRNYRTSAECHVLPALGSRRLSHLTAEHLDRFYGALVEAGYSRSTIRRCHVLLCRVLDQAKRWGSRNPTQGRPVSSRTGSGATSSVSGWLVPDVAESAFGDARRQRRGGRDLPAGIVCGFYDSKMAGLLLCSAGFGAVGPWLDEHVGAARSVTFVDAAARPMDSAPFLDDCKRALADLGCELRELDLTTANHDEPLQPYPGRASFSSPGATRSSSCNRRNAQASSK